MSRPKKKPKTRRVTCEACHRVFTYKVNPKGGRPRVYCDEVCSQWAEASTRLSEIRDEMQSRFVPSLWTTVRSGWWSWCNSRPWNKGVSKEDSATAYCLRRQHETKGAYDRRIRREDR